MTDVRKDEKEFIRSKLLDDEKVGLAAWIEKEKKGKVDNRILVITSFRVLSIKRGALKRKSIRRSAHYYDLVSFTYEPPEHVVFTFKEFFIDLSSSKAEQICSTFLIAYRSATLDFPPPALCELNVPASFEEPVIKKRPAGGLMYNYRSQCAYCEVDCNAKVAAMLQAAVTYDRPILDLKENLATATPAVLEPVLATVRFNTWVRVLDVSCLAAKGVVSLVAKVMQYNTTLTTLLMSDLNNDPDGWKAFGESLQSNTNHSVTSLDISGNKVTKKGFQALMDGLIVSRAPLTRFIASRCSWAGKELDHLFEIFSRNIDISKSLTEVDLGGNRVETIGSVALADWARSLEAAGENRSLAHLSLAHSRPDINALCTTLQTNTLSDLISLNLSSCAFDATGASALAAFCASAPSLCALNLSGSRGEPHIISRVVEGMLGNPSVREVRLDISDNDLGPGGIADVAEALSRSRNLHTLEVSNNGLTSVGIDTLARALAGVETLVGLSCCYNFKDKNKEAEESAIALAGLVASSRTLKTLRVCGDRGSQLAGSVSHILEAIKSNPVLEELDITGNVMGDEGCSVLAQVIAQNMSLRMVVWDKNATTLTGWQSILTAMRENTRLLYLPRPTCDVLMAEAKNKNDYPKLAEQHQVMQDLTVKIDDNYARARTQGHLSARHRVLVAASEARQRMGLLSNPGSAAGGTSSSSSSAAANGGSAAAQGNLIALQFDFEFMRVVDERDPTLAGDPSANNSAMVAPSRGSVVDLNDFASTGFGASMYVGAGGSILGGGGGGGGGMAVAQVAQVAQVATVTDSPYSSDADFGSMGSISGYESGVYESGAFGTPVNYADGPDRASMRLNRGLAVGRSGSDSSGGAVAYAAEEFVLPSPVSLPSFSGGNGAMSSPRGALSPRGFDAGAGSGSGAGSAPPPLIPRRKTANGPRGQYPSVKSGHPRTGSLRVAPAKRGPPPKKPSRARKPSLARNSGGGGAVVDHYASMTASPGAGSPMTAQFASISYGDANRRASQDLGAEEVPFIAAPPPLNFGN